MSEERSETACKLLTLVIGHIDDLLSDLSGFFVSKLMWFLLPEQQGVVLKFNGQDAISANGVSCKEQRCSIKVTDDWQDDNTVLSSHAELISATPWIVK